MRNSGSFASFLRSWNILLFVFLLTHSFPALATSNCAGFQGWFTPYPPSVYGQFGAYVHTMSVYNTSTACDGYATKNAVTGTWQSYATKQTSDGHNTKYIAANDQWGRPQEVYANASSSMTGATASSEATIINSSGSTSNFTRTQDTLKCTVTGASATDLTNIGFKLCYHYETRANGASVTHMADDGSISMQTVSMSGQGDLANWVNGKHAVSHVENGNVIYDECLQGYYVVKGPQGTYKTNMATNAYGTVYQEISGGMRRTDGLVTGTFEITGELPPGVTPPSLPWTCESGSQIFPGADGPKISQAESIKQSDHEVLTFGSYANALGTDCSGAASETGSNADSSGGPGPSKFVGNPINIAQGFKVQSQTDYSGSIGLNFVRTYRSNGEWMSYHLGTFWRHNFDRTLTISSGTTDVAALTDESGVVTYFRLQSDGSWKPYDFDVTTKFESLFDSTPTLIGYAYTRNDNTREIYDTSGKLTRIEYLGSVALNLSYDGSGRLDEVEDESGRTLEFAYDGSDRISTLTTPDGDYTYTYDGNNNLTGVERPDTKTRTYHYEDTSYVNALTGITDERGVRVVTWDYDANGLAVSSEYAGGVGEYTAAYNSDGTVTVTNPLGKETIYTFQELNNVKNVSKLDGQASTHCPASARDVSYTAEGWVASQTDWEGNVTNYAFDSNGLETSRTQAVGETEERTITTTWDSTFRLPDVVTRTGRTTDYDYDAYGRLSSITVTDTNTSETRTWTYTYYSNTTDGAGNTIFGRLKEIDGPRTDVTDKITYAYDANYNLTTITNALGQETEITARDAAGRPTAIEDQNDVETDLTYDTNGWLQTVTVAPGTSLEAVTTFSYDDAGDLTGIELPNGTHLTYTYDNARRLTGVTDDLGNTVTYTLDDAGNVTQTDYKDPSATLKYTHSRTFDEMSRLLTSVGAASAWSRAFAYDKNSNLTQYTDANSHATSFAFDPLQRLSTTTDALSGVTALTWNDLDQNTAVEDPRTNSTTYTYNAFGDITQMVSPDTGTTSFTVDKAGNVTQMTDARSVVTNTTYDAINRLATVSYPSDSSLDVTLTYDDNPGTSGACGTSVGRLCRVVDASGTTDYKYNDLGQLTEVKEVRGSLTFTTAYEYDLAGVLTKITLPSGREVDYALNSNGQVTGVSATVNSSATTLASSITYLPYGPLTGLTYGNSKTLSATFDQDYRPTDRTVSGVFSHTYDTDDEGNITQKGSWTYEYDELNRLDGQDDGSTATGFTYDAIGNRLTENSTSYTYPSTSSKLSSVGSDSYTYDAMGNITDDDALTYTWSAAGLLKEVKTSGTSTVLGTYTYDASNLRTKKVAGSTTTHYVYGRGGKLYGEYDNSGNLIREYVWLNGELLAQVDAGSPEVLTYLHTDHLMTPRAGSNAAGSTVWTWDSGAFGKEAATGSTTVNLRFPGQYFDSETGLHYNWNRYYNPAIGRYVSSDPIGLAGGLNTFGYAGQSPVNIIDFAGLDIAECMISSNPLLCSEGQGGAGTGPRNNSIAGGGVIGLCLIAAGGILEEAIHHAQQSDDSGGSSKPPVSTPGAQAGSPMPDPDDGDDKKKKAKERRAEQRQKALDEKGYDPQKKGTPTRNIDQNAQVDDVQRQLGLSQEQRAELHRRISGENKGYQEILEEAQRIKEGN